jgi:hypothetical protein
MTVTTGNFKGKVTASFAKIDDRSKRLRRAAGPLHDLTEIICQRAIHRRYY